MTVFHTALVILFGYLVGSIPFAVVIARSRGIDILQHGSGNPGASNVNRVIGRKAGFLCFLLDALKGFVSAGLPRTLLIDSPDPFKLALFGLAAGILGHSFSIFLGFRGGKAVATTIGGLLVLTPLVLVISLGVWLVVFFAIRYVSLASMAFGISLPLTGWLLQRSDIEIIFTFLIALFIIVRHRSNLSRLLAGEERRFTKSD